MCGVYIYNGVGCVYSYRGSQTVCLLTNPALPWSPALLPFPPMTSSGRWPPGSRSPTMHLHPDSIKRTLGASGLVLPHQHRGVIPDVGAADRSRCAGVRIEKASQSLSSCWDGTLQREAIFTGNIWSVLQQVQPAGDPRPDAALPQNAA